MELHELDALEQRLRAELPGLLRSEQPQVQQAARNTQRTLRQIAIARRRIAARLQRTERQYRKEHRES